MSASTNRYHLLFWKQAWHAEKIGASAGRPSAPVKMCCAPCAPRQPILTRAHTTQVNTRTERKVEVRHAQLSTRLADIHHEKSVGPAMAGVCPRHTTVNSSPPPPPPADSTPAQTLIRAPLRNSHARARPPDFQWHWLALIPHAAATRRHYSPLAIVRAHCQRLQRAFGFLCGRAIVALRQAYQRGDGARASNGSLARLVPGC